MNRRLWSGIVALARSRLAVVSVALLALALAATISGRVSAAAAVDRDEMSALRGGCGSLFCTRDWQCGDFDYFCGLGGCDYDTDCGYVGVGYYSQERDRCHQRLGPAERCSEVPHEGCGQIVHCKCKIYAMTLGEMETSAGTCSKGYPSYSWYLYMPCPPP